MRVFCSQAWVSVEAAVNRLLSGIEDDAPKSTRAPLPELATQPAASQSGGTGLDHRHAPSFDPAWSKFMALPTQSSESDRGHGLTPERVHMVADITDMGFEEKMARSALEHVVRSLTKPIPERLPSAETNPRMQADSYESACKKDLF